MITYFQKSIKEKTFRTIDGLKPGTWIYCENPTPEEIQTLATQCHLDPGVLNDALDPYEVPRLEIGSDAVYIFVRFPVPNEDILAVSAPVLIIQTSDFIATVSRLKLPFLEALINKPIDVNTTQKTKLTLQLMAMVHMSYFNAFSAIQKNIKRISIDIEKITNKDIIRFIKFETELNEYMSDLVPTNSMLNTLLSGKTIPLFEKDKELMHDVLLSNAQLIEECKSNLKTISNIRDAYSTIMTNNTNRIVRLLTAVTILLTIPMVISSFFGMNVALPTDNNPYGFFIIVLCTGLFSAGIFFLFYKNRWF